MAERPKNPLPNIRKLAKKERAFEAQEVKDILSNLQQQVKTMQALGNETKFLKTGFQNIQAEILGNLTAIENIKNVSNTFKSITGDLNKLSLENLQIGLKRAEQHDKIGTSQFREINLQDKIFEIAKLKFKIEDDFKTFDEKALKNKNDILETETKLGFAAREAVKISKKLRLPKGAARDRVEELRDILKQQKAERTTYSNRDIERTTLEEQRKLLEKDLKEQKEKNKLDKQIHDDSMRFTKEVMKPLKNLQSLIHKLPGGSFITTLFNVDDKSLNDLSTKISKKFAVSFKKIKKNGGSTFDALKDALPGIGKELLGWAKSITGVHIGVAALIVLVALAWKRFVEIDKITRTIRDTTGFTGDNLNELRTQTVALNLEFQKYGINLQDAARISVGLVSTLGSLRAVTKEDAENVASMTKLFGVSAEEAGKLYKVVLDMAGGNAEIASQTAATVKSLAKQTGVSPQAAFKDLAMNAEFVARFTKDGGKNMIEAAFAARKFGMELGTLVKISENLLDFETSIRGQLEASFFLGRNLNLDRARYAAFTGDIASLQEELLVQMGSVKEFNNLDVITRQKLAGAIGITTAELLHYLTVQERLNIVGNDSLSIQQKLAQGATLGDLLKLDKEVLTDLEKFQLSIENLFVSLGTALLPILDILGPVLSALGDIFNVISTTLQLFGEGLSMLSVPLEILGVVFGVLIKIIVGGAALIAAAFLITNPFAWIAAAIVAIGYFKDFFVGVWDFLFGNTVWSGDTIKAVFDDIANAIQVVGTFIWDAITWPYRTAWDFISNLLEGTIIGDKLMAMVDFIKGIGHTIFDALTWPFTAAYDFLFGNTVWSVDTIKGIFEPIVSIIESIFGGIQKILETVFLKPFTLIADVVKSIFGGVEDVTLKEIDTAIIKNLVVRDLITPEFDLPKNIGRDMPDFNLPKNIGRDMPDFNLPIGVVPNFEPIKIEPAKTEISSESKKVIDAAIKVTAPEKITESDPDKVMVAVAQKLDTLIELMSQPAVINMDGRKVGEQIARRIPRKGGV